jgi:hypothetical protein
MKATACLQACVTTQQRFHAIKRTKACSSAPERKRPNFGIPMEIRLLHSSARLWLEDVFQRGFLVGMEHEVAGHEPSVLVHRRLAHITGKHIIVCRLLKASTHCLSWCSILQGADCKHERWKANLPLMQKMTRTKKTTQVCGRSPLRITTNNMFILDSATSLSSLYPDPNLQPFLTCNPLH